MKSILSLLVILSITLATLNAQEPAAGAAAKQDSATAKTVEFKRSAPVVGDIVSLASKSTGQSSREMIRDDNEPRVTKSSNKRVVKKKTEILAVSKDVPTKWRVTYNELMRENKRDGGGNGQRRGGRGGARGGNNAEPAADLSELVKKTFIVTITDGVAAVADAEGKEVKADVARAVKRQELRQEKFAGFGPDLTSIIPAGKMKVGQSIDVPAELARTLIGNGGGRRMARGGRGGRGGEGGRGGRGGRGGQGQNAMAPKVTLTLEDTVKVFNRDAAVFNVTVVMPKMPEREGLDMDMTAKQEGKIVVGLADSRVYRMNMKSESTTEMIMDRGDSSMEMTSESKNKSESMWIHSKAVAKQ